MLTATQVDQLLKPINPVRVLRDGKGMSHVSQQDVTAHLTRIFGFGGWTTELLSLNLVFETPRTENAEQPWRTRYDCCYRATVRLSILSPEDAYGVRPIFCSYENGSTGDAQNLVRAEAHDLAMKSAISLALKRCAINLGDQFGLSLYNKGQVSALVRATLVMPEDFTGTHPEEDVQQGVPQQVSLGTDETVYDDHLDEPTEEQRRMLEQSLGAQEMKA